MRWTEDRQGNTNPLPGVLLLVTLLGVGSMGLVVPASSAVGTGSPLPFDPPSAEEHVLAPQIALADPRIAEVLDGHRYVVLGVALGTEKVPDVAVRDLNRTLDVWFYDYTDDRIVWAVVDPAAEAMVHVVPTPPTFHIPLAGVEIERARELALELPAIAFWVTDALPVSAVLTTGEGTHCPEHRCALIAFIDGRPITERMVLVDLSEDRAVTVLDGWAEAFP